MPQAGHLRQRSPLTSSVAVAMAARPFGDLAGTRGDADQVIVDDAK